MKYWYIDYPEEIEIPKVDSKFKEFEEERQKMINEIHGLTVSGKPT